jgi:hypothetical protein
MRHGYGDGGLSDTSGTDDIHEAMGLELFRNNSTSFVAANDPL